MHVPLFCRLHRSYSEHRQHRGSIIPCYHGENMTYGMYMTFRDAVRSPFVAPRAERLTHLTMHACAQPLNVRIGASKTTQFQNPPRMIFPARLQNSWCGGSWWASQSSRCCLQSWDAVFCSIIRGSADAWKLHRLPTDRYSRTVSTLRPRQRQKVQLLSHMHEQHAHKCELVRQRRRDASARRSCSTCSSSSCMPLALPLDCLINSHCTYALSRHVLPCCLFAWGIALP
jgi:hypothetical protein